MKNIAETLERCLAVRQERLALQKQADKLAEEEKDLMATAHAELLALGKRAYVTDSGIAFKLQAVRKPVVTDWDELHDYIAETNNFSLLHARLTDSAVKELWDAGVTVPGVTFNDMDVPKLTTV